MSDFFRPWAKRLKGGGIEIIPKFIIKNSEDLMIRGGDFYAVWVDERGLWSTDEQDVITMVDRELEQFAKNNKERYDGSVTVAYMWDAGSGSIDAWHKYCKQQMRDNFHMLDEKLVFSNMEVKKTDYASKKLSYPLEAGDISAFDKLIGTLYSPEERHKIEWAIGAIVSGDSKKLQKFMVLYGEFGTGKSTVINIFEKLFDGYTSTVDADSLGSSSNAFALESFRNNPLVAIQHEGNLSRIETNTRINSLVSHESMTVNEKFKSAYTTRFKSFLILASNNPVRISDAKSGLLRRLIDVTPTGNKIPEREYDALVQQIDFELGAIAKHCLDVYLSDPKAYNNYIPSRMLGATNDFYNFVEDSYFVFKEQDGVSLTSAWAMYKTYCDEAKVKYPYPRRPFAEELRAYFREVLERPTLEDGTRPRTYYKGFRSDKFEMQKDGISPGEVSKNTIPHWLELKEQPSALDKICADCPAQYASEKETPLRKWENVTTKLSDLDTSRLHYLKGPGTLIFADFDLRDESGNKCLERNIEAARKWRETYAEVSKGGHGLHLYYFYTGDPSKLSCVFDEHIEIKTCTGNSSIRRRLTLCNNLPVATISSGLPLKGEKMVNADTIKSERSLRSLIRRNLNKEIHPSTKPSVDFIYKILEDAYKSGLKYDVTDMRPMILSFAANSTHQADTCIKLVNKMHFSSDEHSDNVDCTEPGLVFFDVEVFPNLFLVNYKMEGPDKTVTRMINPTPGEIEKLMQFRLVGFNCRRYDNHILYARLMGYTNEQLFQLSQKIISGSPNCFFGEAYNVSYTDIYDFASSGNKKSLKKLEIEMGIHHQELGLPWDQPVPEDQWMKVAEYCDNDVIATEAAFHYLSGDWTARQILADLAGMTVNDTTNQLTARIIFGKEKHPQSQFHYRDMGSMMDCQLCNGQFNICDSDPDNQIENGEYTIFDDFGQPVFPGYKYENGKSTYRGEEVGEGGYVYAEPGIYSNVALLDIASMHPSSVVAENLFGDEYTEKFKELMDARIAIKHEDWNTAETMMGGKLRPYIQKVKNGELTSKQLANALKTAINSVYGLTSAKFDNPFRDPRNVDNIVAKRGALFMINLKNEVQKRCYTVAHIKTDSIKIPDATPEIIQFVMDYGKTYGYAFEHEATYDRMCLVNDAVYIARYKNPDGTLGKWTATGAQFAVPYVFKMLFTHEDICFNDLCETKSVTSALYLDMNEGLPEEEHSYHFIGRVGQFCPILPGYGGGILLREKDGKYYAVGGTKGYRWLESEMVKVLGKQDCIDRSYYDRLVDDAKDAIAQHGDFEMFVSDEPYEEELPF